DKSIDFNKMPPLSKRVVDQPYIDVLTAWINTLGDDCEGDFISDLDWVSATNGEGPVERDRANGYAPPRDGKIITIAGKQFTKGLGTRANAEIEFDLNAEYVQFNTYIGIDDRTCDDANVYFEVYVDGELRYESPVMKKGLEPRFVSVDIRGAHSLRLLTQSRDGSQICDQADWANARLLRVPDSDGDGICDEQDICPGFDDRQDINNDGVPDGCENIFTPETLNMSVLPTPFTEYTDIILTRPDASVKPARLAVYDLSGRVIHQDFQVDYGMRYALGYDWQVGVYVIVVKAGKYENRMKVVKLE
ncbi:MAG: NPCBM/NEW2 domain-containing protein, partial [Bacteroidia bacterium]